MSQSPRSNSCCSRLSNARARFRSLTAGHTALARLASSALKAEAYRPSTASMTTAGDTAGPAARGDVRAAGGGGAEATGGDAGGGLTIAAAAGAALAAGAGGGSSRGPATELVGRTPVVAGTGAGTVSTARAATGGVAAWTSGLSRLGGVTGRGGSLTRRDGADRAGVLRPTGGGASLARLSAGLTARAVSVTGITGACGAGSITRLAGGCTGGADATTSVGGWGSSTPRPVSDFSAATLRIATAASAARATNLRAIRAIG